MGEELPSAGAGLYAIGPGLDSASSDSDAPLPSAGLAEAFGGGVVAFCSGAAEADVEDSALGEGVWSGVEVEGAGLEVDEGLLGWAWGSVGLFQPLVCPFATVCLETCSRDT